MALTRRGHKKNGSFFGVRPYFYGPRNTRRQELFLSLRERATFVAAILRWEEKRLRATDEGNGSHCLPATMSVVAFWFSAGFATARMLQGCYMVQRQGVRGSRFDSDDVQTCGIIVLLLCGQVQLNVYRFWWWWCRFVLIFYSCLSSSSACSSWSFSSLICFAMRDASSNRSYLYSSAFLLLLLVLPDHSLLWLIMRCAMHQW